MKKKTRTRAPVRKKTVQKKKKSKKISSQVDMGNSQMTNEKVFLKKMIENIFPQMTQQILDRANLIRQQLRRRGPKS